MRKIPLALKLVVLFVNNFVVIYSILSNDPSYKLFGVICAIISPSIMLWVTHSHLENSK